MLDNLTPESKLTREKAALALSALGYPTSKLSLATLACRGGGPSYQRYGRRALYCWADLLAWAEGRLTAPIRSTSEADAIDVSDARKRRTATVASADAQ
jgi:hypothetical protein